MNIIKRSGKEVVFDITKIINAISKANNEVNEKDRLLDDQIYDISDKIKRDAISCNRALTVEEIQDKVEKYIVELNKYEVARVYILYRYERALDRKDGDFDKKILSLTELDNEVIKQENANKNPIVNSTQRDYMAGEISKELCRKYVYPDRINKAHDLGIIHNHDLDYKIQHMNNCGLVNLKDMLMNGTVISGTLIEKPHRFSTACNIMTQIIAQVASAQYGGQSETLADLVPFIQLSRQEIRKEVLDDFDNDISEDKLNEIVEKRLRKEIKAGVQTIQYQIITLLTTNGQAPFDTLFMYLNEVEGEQEKQDFAMLIEEVLLQRITGVKNEDGAYITTAFPKLIYVLEEDNIHEDSKYWYLTELAAKCTAKRMVPDYISEKIMKSLKIDDNGVGHCYSVMGCRSALTPYLDKNGEFKTSGRFNQGVVTINLVDVALSSEKDFNKFWDIFDERLELCYEALMITHKRLLGTPSDVAPILWQHGAYARLKPGEPIDELLFNNYSTISLGYAGLYECVKYMTGVSHTDDAAKPFALMVMKYMNDKCAKWRAETTIGFSLYGTPIESTTYKFAKCLQNRFGIIEGVTDHSYITNSYHCNVREEIDAFTKLKFESEFQALSPGG